LAARWPCGAAGCLAGPAPEAAWRDLAAVQPVPDWMSCAAPPGHLAVPAGGTAVLPWTHDRMGQPAARAAAARHSAGLGARLPVRRVRTRVRRLVSELALRGPLRLPAEPEPRKLDSAGRQMAGFTAHNRTLLPAMSWPAGTPITPHALRRAHCRRSGRSQRM